MNKQSINLDPQWLEYLQDEFEQDYMLKLSAFLRAEKAAGKIIYPQGKNIFAALNATPLSQVKVVILGQDPYHGPNQAHGLSFSVPRGERIPPSLLNMYKELIDDQGCYMPTHGNLSAWAEQGVLLLNSVLSVEQALAGSHQTKGWEQFTDHIVSVLNQHNENLVFLLWGANAQKKGQVISKGKHLVLHAPHPSPLSAHRGFLGCHHFSQANAYLDSNGIAPIDWQIV